jgi:hypothetical protein
MQERFMRTYQWLTLGAAIVITALEAWLFTGTSALASQPDAPAATMAAPRAAVYPTSVEPPRAWGNHGVPIIPAQVASEPVPSARA